MIDWQLLIILLRKHGKKSSIIAKECCLGYDHVKRLGAGTVSQPFFNSGIRLLDYAYENLPTDEFMRVKM